MFINKAKLRKSKVALALMLASTVAMYNTPTKADGLLGGALKWVGDRTGVKPLKKLGTELDNVSRDMKKEIPAVQVVEEAISRPVREAGKWANNNKEVVSAVAVVAVAGWAVCIDGCTFTANLLAAGATIPVFSSDVNSKNGKIDNIKQNKKTAKNKKLESYSDKCTNEEEEMGGEYNFEKHYPESFSKLKYPENGPRPKLVYSSLNENLPKILNEFSMPTKNAIVRFGLGEMNSPRNTKNEKYSAIHGKYARRTHASIDVLTFPGQDIYAPLSGKVIASKPLNNANGLHIIIIEAHDKTRAKLLYVAPDEELKLGSSVKAGETRIGKAENLGLNYDLDKVPNHVHLQYIDFKDRAFNPFTNEVIDRHQWRAEVPVTK